MINSEQIREHKFAQTEGGYDIEAVDSYLEKLANEFEELFNENREIIKRLSVFARKIEDYKKNEGVVADTLLTAQKSAAQTVAGAEAVVKKMLESAKKEGKNIINQARDDAKNISLDRDTVLNEAQNTARDMYNNASAAVEEMFKEARKKCDAIISEAEDKAMYTVEEATSESEAVLSDAKKTADEILDKAQAEASRIIDNAKNQVFESEIYTKAVEELKTETENKKNQLEEDYNSKTEQFKNEIAYFENAREQADSIISDAEKQAEAIISEAKRQAEEIIGEAENLIKKSDSDIDKNTIESFSAEVIPPETEVIPCKEDSFENAAENIEAQENESPKIDELSAAVDSFSLDVFAFDSGDESDASDGKYEAVVENEEPASHSYEDEAFGSEETLEASETEITASTDDIEEAEFNIENEIQVQDEIVEDEELTQKEDIDTKANEDLFNAMFDDIPETQIDSVASFTSLLDDGEDTDVSTAEEDSQPDDIPDEVKYDSFAGSVFDDIDFDSSTAEDKAVEAEEENLSVDEIEDILEKFEIDFSSVNSSQAEETVVQNKKNKNKKRK